MATLYAELLDAGIKPWEVGRLTNWQIAHVVRHAREKTGELKRQREARSRMAWSLFAEMMRDRGLSNLEIAERWRRTRAEP